MFTGTTGTLPNDLISRYNQVEIPFKSNNFRPTFLLTDRRCRRPARWAWCRRWRWRLRLWWCPGEWSSWDSSGHLMDNAGFMVYVLTQVTRRHTHNICSLTWHVGAGHDPRAAVEHDGEHGGEGHRGLRCVIYSVISCRKTSLESMLLSTPPLFKENFNLLHLPAHPASSCFGALEKAILCKASLLFTERHQIYHMIYFEKFNFAAPVCETSILCLLYLYQTKQLGVHILSKNKTDLWSPFSDIKAQCQWFPGLCSV